MKSMRTPSVRVSILGILFILSPIRRRDAAMPLAG
jgi:hypothetical protein